MSKNAFENAVVIFDLDGTLIDTAGDLARSMNHVLEENGLRPLPPAHVRHLVGRGARVMLERGFEKRAGKVPDKTAMKAHLALFLAHYEQNIARLSRPFEHAVETISLLRAAGAKTAICTNKRENLTRLLIETLKLTEFFDAIVGADTAAAPKPDPAPVLLCLKKTGAARGVFVGDSDTDIAAAQAANLPCLLAGFGYGPRENADLAAAHFTDFRELPDLAASALME